MGKVQDMIKEIVKKTLLWLEFLPAQEFYLTIQEQATFQENVMKNRILYRGDPSEMDQFFHQTARDLVQRARFWASSPSKGLNIRKFHSGLPGMIVNVLADIVVTDMLNVEFPDNDMSGLSKVWDDVAAENRFKKLVTHAIQEVLVVGDGAFKVSIDTDLSDVPILEFFGGELVEFDFNRGRIQEIRFLGRYEQNKRNYTLIERYGPGYVKYELLTQGGDQVPLSTVDDLAELQDLDWDGDYMMAVPLLIYPSPKWAGRGRSIYDLKTDSFDALDETISQWQDAIRLGRIKRYIPESMLPKDPATGETLPVNPLDNQFTALADSMRENGEARILTEQPIIAYDSYIATYINNLDMCLQGIVSPSTLGIDTKKLDNAEAQREKEKTTLYTRQKIISVLQEVLPSLVDVTLKAYGTLNKQTVKDVGCTVEFGEYANPSFEAQVDVLSRAAGAAIMSIEAQVETLWGDTKDKKWKATEVSRIKALKGILETEEPSVRPHGFKEDLEGVNGMGGPVNRDSNADGAGLVRADGEALEPSHRVGDAGRLPVDTVAGGSTS